MRKTFATIVRQGSASLSAGAFASLVLAAPASAQENIPDLFEGSSAATPDSRSFGAVRSWTVRVNQHLIGGDYGALPPAARIRINPFPGLDLIVVLDRSKRTLSGHAWIGKGENVPLADVVLVTVNGALRGSITMPGASYWIRARDGVGVVSEIDERLLPRGDDTVIPPPAPAADRADVPNIEDGRTIDVAVFYTNTAQRNAESDNALRAAIDLAVANTNTAFRNSGIATELRHVHTGAVDYEDSGDANLDLERLQAPSDGVMDEVHALRDRVGADLVALIPNRDADVCGIAYTPSSYGLPAWGFSITQRVCLGHELTFAHEVGHNLGAQHDWYVNPAGGAFSYSHGHNIPDYRMRTIMAYSALCDALDVSCRTIQWFSNPSIKIQGTDTAIGVSIDGDDTCPEGDTEHWRCQADNTLTLNWLRHKVANYRLSRSTGGHLPFPARNETFDFRQELDRTYRDRLKRRTTDFYTNVEGSVVWIQEYLMYRVHRCDHESATRKVRLQISNEVLPAVCGSPAAGAIQFPPRNETLAFRMVLEDIYRDDLNRKRNNATHVDLEGDVVWIQEYLRYRLNRCSHAEAEDRVLRQIAGEGVPPTC